MKKITFCVNTTKSEKAHVELLLQSLLNGIDVNFHDIIIFVDSSTPESLEMLKAQKEVFPNLTIIHNTSDIPLNHPSNVNYMFSKAKTDIVAYLQSDMVVCLDYDKKILSHLKDNMVLCSTRVEPPLHSQCDNPITFVKNFGLIPDEFKYEEFLQYAEMIKNPNKLTKYFFAPFSLYKHLWLDIGGHDPIFTRSREDSDIAMRFSLKKYDIVQCWDAIVYHFTCTSSRGIEWWKPENRERELARQQTDEEMLRRFIKKWGTFIHSASYDDIKPYLDAHPDIVNNIIMKNPPIDESKLIIL